MNQSFEVVYRKGGVEETTLETDLLVAGGNYYLRFAATPPGTSWDMKFGGPVVELIRSTKLKQLLNHVAQQRAVMVRAPPMIGKSVLGRQLLRYRALFDTVRLFDLSRWNPKTHSIETYCGIKLPETLADLTDMPRTLWILDEAQKLNYYSRTHDFWMTVKAIENQFSPRLHLILLAVYGESPSSQVIITEHLATPVLNFKLDFNIVLLDRSEFDIIVHQYNSATKGVQIHDRVFHFVFHYFGGHPGLTATLLSLLHSSSASVSVRNRDKTNGTYSTNEILNLIIDRMGALQRTRSVPSLDNSKLSSHSKAILQLLFNNGGEVSIDLCSRYQNGVAPLLSGYYIAAHGDGAYRFATPFHYFYYLSRRPRITETSTIDELMEWSLRGIDISALRMTRSVGTDRLVLEDAFKCALVVQLTNYLPLGWQCHTEVGAFFNCPGQVDLWILPNRWAIELLRDYGRAEEHYERFVATQISMRQNI